MVWYVVDKQDEDKWLIRCLFLGTEQTVTLADMQGMVDAGDSIYGFVDDEVDCAYGDDFFATQVTVESLYGPYSADMFLIMDMSCTLRGFCLEPFDRNKFAAVIPPFVTNLCMAVMRDASTPTYPVVHKLTIPTSVSSIVAGSAEDIDDGKVQVPRFRLQELVIPKTVLQLQPTVFKAQQGGSVGVRYNTLGVVRFEGVLQKIPQYCFYRCRIDELQFPIGLTEIEASAFGHAILRHAVVLPETLETIETQVFYKASVPEIQLPTKKPLVLGSAAFSGATIKGMQLSANVNIDVPQLFEGCRQLETLELPEDTVTLKHSFCKDCSALTTVSHTEKIVDFDASCFAGCGLLETFEFSSALEHLGECAFQGTGFKSLNLTFADGDIETGAFQDCVELRSVKFSGTVFKLRAGLFYRCTSLELLDLSEISCDYLPCMLCEDCRSLETVKFPIGVTNIAERAFEGCSKLQHVQIPNTVKIIGVAAFAGTGITDIVIPEGVATICGDAFAGTKFHDNDYDYADTYAKARNFTHLHSITFPRSLVSIDSGIFGRLSYGLTEQVLCRVHEGSHAHEWVLRHGYRYQLIEG